MGMTPDRIDPALVEKAVEVFWEIYDAPHRDDDAMEAAICVVFDKLRLKEEFSVVHEDGRRQETNKNSALTLTFHPSGRRMESRLRSDWRPVEQGDAK